MWSWSRSVMQHGRRVYGSEKVEVAIFATDDREPERIAVLYAYIPSKTVMALLTVRPFLSLVRDQTPPTSQVHLQVQTEWSDVLAL